MSDKITLGNLRIKCRFPIITLLKCRIHSGYGEHTQAQIECIVKGNEIKKRLADIAGCSFDIVVLAVKKDKVQVDIQGGEWGVADGDKWFTYATIYS